MCFNFSVKITLQETHKRWRPRKKWNWIEIEPQGPVCRIQWHPNLFPCFSLNKDVGEPGDLLLHLKLWTGPSKACIWFLASVLSNNMLVQHERLCGGGPVPSVDTKGSQFFVCLTDNMIWTHFEKSEASTVCKWALTFTRIKLCENRNWKVSNRFAIKLCWLTQHVGIFC